MLNKTKKYIDENNKRPSEDSKNEDIKYIGRWLSNQLKVYKKNTMNKNRKKQWNEFMVEYQQYFMSNEERWINMLYMVKKYIDENDNSLLKILKMKILNVWVNGYPIKNKIIKTILKL